MSNKNEKGIIIQKKHIIIALIIFLLLLIGNVTVAFNWSNWFSNGDRQQLQTCDDSSVSKSDIDPNANSWSGEQPDDKGGEEAGIKIPGYPSITIPADTENVTVALLNPEDNPCYFKFQLVLKDTDELLYESKLVPPGDAITEITLLKSLPEGEYDATIKISTLSLDGKTELNGANVETVLIAK